MAGYTRGKKGQAGLEKIILYSAAILVILIGMYVLWEIGAFQPVIGRKGTVGFAQVVVGDWVVSNNNNVYVELINEAEANILIRAFDINASTDLVTCTRGPTENIEIPPGQRRIVTFTCDQSPSIQDRYNIGDFYTMDLDINYTNMLTSRMHESIGKLYGTIEADQGTIISPPTTIQPWCKCGRFSCTEENNFDPVFCEEELCTGEGLVDEMDCTFCFRGDTPDQLTPEPRCWPRFQCGLRCTGDPLLCNRRTWTWPDGFPDYLKVNPCPECREDPNDPLEMTCQPDPGIGGPDPGDCGDECTEFGSDEDPLCLDEDPEDDCNYCQWYDLYDLFEGSVDRVAECSPLGECGSDCSENDNEYQTYDECIDRNMPRNENPCPWCNTSAPDPGPGMTGLCEQGDCGKHCNGNYDCELGCKFCNTTVKRCELGDCGKPCASILDCEQGCTCCTAEGTCVACRMNIEVNVTNSTGGKYIIDPNEDILVKVKGTQRVDGSASIVEVWNSNVTIVKDVAGATIEEAIENANQKCLSEVHARFDPFERLVTREVLEGDVEPSPATPEWMSGGIQWIDGNADGQEWRKTDCTSNPDCVGQGCCRNVVNTHGWENSSYHCYYGIAKEDETMGRGIFSQIKCDCIQVGYINVYLIFPKNPPTVV